jgi:uncharacterized protein (TIGR02466 family)
MNLELLFPTPVAFFDLGRDLAKKESDFLAKQDRRPNQGNQSSVDNYVLDKPALAKLKDGIQKCVEEYVKDVWKVDKTLGVRITQSWLNWTRDGQYHHKHAHPNSVFSGVFYVNAKEDRDRITFHKDGYKQIKPKYDEYTRWNSESWWLPVKTGQIVLFPSSLTHMVESIGGEEERISLAFNTFLTGKVGDNQSLTELIV